MTLKVDLVAAEAIMSVSVELNSVLKNVAM